jgi:hypothetical protein
LLVICPSLSRVHSLRVDTRSENLGKVIAAIPSITYLRVRCPLSVIEETWQELKRPGLRIKLLPVFADHSMSFAEVRALTALAPASVMVERGLNGQQELRLLETIRTSLDSLSGYLSGTPTLLQGEWPKLEQLDADIKPGSAFLMKHPAPMLKRLTVHSEATLPASFLERGERLKSLEAITLKAPAFEPGLLTPLPFLTSPMTRLRLLSSGELGLAPLLPSPWYPQLTHLALQGTTGKSLDAMLGPLRQLRLLELDIEHPPLSILEYLEKKASDTLFSLELRSVEDDEYLAAWLTSAVAQNVRFMRGPRLGPKSLHALASGQAPRLTAFEIAAEGITGLEELAASGHARDISSMKIWASLPETTSKVLADRSRFPFLKDVRVALPSDLQQVGSRESAFADQV